MKKSLLAISGILLGCIISSTAFSDNASQAPLVVQLPASCQNIMNACVAGMPGVSQDDLLIKCMQPITLGQTVPGVTVNQSDVQTCATILKGQVKQ